VASRGDEKARWVHRPGHHGRRHGGAALRARHDAKDLDQAIDTAGRAGLEVPLMHAVRERYRDAIRKGRAALDFAAIAER